MPDALPGVDYAAVFDSQGVPQLIIDRRLVVLAANAAWLGQPAFGHVPVIGRRLDEALLLDPSVTAETSYDYRIGIGRLMASVQRAIDLRSADAISMQRFDLPAAPGRPPRSFYWRVVNSPVMDLSGQVSYVVFRMEDITDLVADPAVIAPDSDVGRLKARNERAQLDLYARGLQLRETNEQLQLAAQRERRMVSRLSGLVAVSFRLAQAETTQAAVAAVLDCDPSRFDAHSLAFYLVDDDRMGVRLAGSRAVDDRAITPLPWMPWDSPLPAARVSLDGERLLLHDRAEAFAMCPENAAALRGSVSQAWAMLPVQNSDRRYGAVSFGFISPQEFGEDEVSVMEALAAQAAQTLRRIELTEIERRRAADSMALAETLQRAMLTDPPEIAGAQLAVRYLPASQADSVGGDWYDAFALPSGATVLAIGDVSGHDRASAAVMGQLRNMVRGIAYSETHTPSGMLAALERAMSGLGMASLATCILVIACPQPDGWHITWANAGHPPPLLIADDGQTRMLDPEADLLVGFGPDSERTDHELLLTAGQTVVLYTDGLVERPDLPVGDGIAALLSSAQDAFGMSLPTVCDALIGPARESRLDDVALLAFRAGEPQETR